MRLEFARPWVRFPAGLRCVFSSDPAVSSSIFVQCCQALPFKLRIVGPLFADFSMILRILSQYFLKKKRERKTTRRKRNDETYARKRCRHNPAFSLHKKKLIIPVLEPPFFPTKLFYGHMRDRKMTWTTGGKKGQVMLGDTVDIIVSLFITLLERLSFAGAAKYIIDPLPATSTGSLDSRGIWPSRDGKCQ